MEIKKLLLMAAGAIALTACSNDGDTNGLNSSTNPVELRLSSSLDDQTRAYTATQGTKIANGQTVYVWADEDKASPTEYLKAWTLTSDGNDGWQAGYTPKYYPASGNALNIYALHGNFTAPTEDNTSFQTSLTHAVLADQSAANAYEQSDLLFAKKTSCARQAAAHQLVFKHQLSKIEVYLYPGTGVAVADLNNATVSLLNTRLKADVTLNKANAADAQTIALYAGTDIDTENPKTAITMRQAAYSATETLSFQKYGATSATTQNVPIFAEAIIVPQFVNTTGATGGAAVQFIKVKLDSGGELYASVNKQFVKGTKYTYYVEVGLNALTISSTITDWTAGDSDAIQAGMPTS